MKTKMRLIASLKIWAVIYPSITLFLYFLGKPLSKLTDTLNEQLTELSTRFSKYQKSSRLKRYLTPTVVGIVSALVTNLIWWIVS